MRTGAADLQDPLGAAAASGRRPVPPRRKEHPVSPSNAKARTADPIDAARAAEEVAYLAKRHRVSAAVVREIIRRVGSTERAAIEREIAKGKARR